ncbi:SRPBCC domain-containing protein [Candidatus Peribacteria bacterium]|nr:SRPBCC domain-containing protein [Candidatus Peribacteria bacterium]
MTQLTVSITINAPLEKVWEAFWKPEHIVHWCFASDDWHCPKAIGEEPKVGGVFTNTFAAKDGSFSFDLTGQYNEVIPRERAVYTMGEMKEYFLDAGRKVTVTFEQQNNSVLVTEVFDAEEIHSAEQQVQGWQAILENFKKYVESSTLQTS